MEFVILISHHAHATLTSCKLRPPLQNAGLEHNKILNDALCVGWTVRLTVDNQGWTAALGSTFLPDGQISSCVTTVA